MYSSTPESYFVHLWVCSVCISFPFLSCNDVYLIWIWLEPTTPCRIQLITITHKMSTCTWYLYGNDDQYFGPCSWSAWSRWNETKFWPELKLSILHASNTVPLRLAVGCHSIPLQRGCSDTSQQMSDRMQLLLKLVLLQESEINWVAYYGFPVPHTVKSTKLLTFQYSFMMSTTRTTLKCVCASSVCTAVDTKYSPKRTFGWNNSHDTPLMI